MQLKAKIILFPIVTLIMINIALALAIAPGTVELTSNAEIFIINNEHKDMDVMLYAQGSFADKLEISNALVHVSSTEDTKTIDIKVNDISLPGTHEIELVAMEIPTASEGKGTVIAARQAVIAKIIVKNPYPGKFAVGKLVIPKTNANEPVNFVIKLENLGTQTINNAKARIEIYGSTNEIITVLVSDEKSIEQGQMRELVAKYHNGLPQGRYYAKAIVKYDSNELELEETFEIGSVLIEIKNIYVEQFRLGDIAKFDIVIENKWNELIPDVYAEMDISDTSGKSMTKFKTAEIDLSKDSTDILQAYWDTRDVDSGLYKATLTLHFLGNNLQKKMVLTVRSDAIDIDFSPTAMATSATTDDSKMPFIIILIVLSMIVNISLIIWFAKRKQQ